MYRQSTVLPVKSLVAVVSHEKCQSLLACPVISSAEYSLSAACDVRCRSDDVNASYAGVTTCSSAGF